jgi:uncharacterized membrane protein
MGNELPDSPSCAQRVGQWLTWAALLVAVIALFSMFVLPELFEPYSMASSNLFFTGLNLGLCPLPLALAGWITCKAARVPPPRFRLPALILGLVAMAPIVLFVIAYSNCPNGIC